NRLARVTHAMERPLARTVGLPDDQAGQIQLPVTRVKTSAHDPALEFEGKLDRARLTDAVDFLVKDGKEGAGAVRGMEQVALEGSPPVTGHPDLASAGVVQL